MNFKRKITLRLSNHSPELFLFWKSIEAEVTEIFKSYGVKIFDASYTEKTKTVMVEYDEFENYHEAVIGVAQFGASKGLLLEQVSVENFDTRGIKCSSLIDKYKERMVTL